MTFIVIAAKIIVFLFQGALQAPQLDWLKKTAFRSSLNVSETRSPLTRQVEKSTPPRAVLKNDVPRYLLPLVLNAFKLQETSSAEDISLFFTWVSDSLHLSKIEYPQFEDSKATL